ncbi:T9SS type A sorting domain-containing protein [Mucilaginibacter sp. McL0603]|uniref:T9SS type A sorting domain-containing protein n=1 Tax=Mucilaginibacter sp. McL0603 TaxID=3415670 RepID=UPI003CED19F4
MKNYWIKPGFEFIFALSLIVIMALPPLVFAQGTKDMEIKITNGDTTINGKNIKELSADDRNQALKDIGNLGGPESIGQQHIIIKKRGASDTVSKSIVIEDRHFRIDKEPEMANMPGFGKDTTGRMFRFRMKRMGGKDSTFTYDYKLNGDRFRDRDFDFPTRDREMRSYRHRNVQRFEYTNTGSDGIDTYVSFRVSDVSPEKLKAITGSEKAELEIKDLNLVPEFSSGKTLLMFGLTSKSVAEVKLTDNDGKLIWSDKAMNGSFNKSFVLGLNGIYFLQIKQGGKTALKRIMKDE